MKKSLANTKKGVALSGNPDLKEKKMRTTDPMTQAHPGGPT
jgi:hypothetical protein